MKLIKNPYFKRRGRWRRIKNLRLLLMPKLRKYVFFSFQRSKVFYLVFWISQTGARYTFKLSLGHKIHLKESVTKRFQAESRVKVTYQDHNLKKYFFLYSLDAQSTNFSFLSGKNLWKKWSFHSRFKQQSLLANQFLKLYNAVANKRLLIQTAASTRWTNI